MAQAGQWSGSAAQEREEGQSGGLPPRKGAAQEGVRPAGSGPPEEDD